MKGYTATAVRDGAWWMLEITGPGLRRPGATQVKRLEQAEAMARDWIRTRFDTITDADFTIEVVAEFDAENESIVENALAKRLAAEAASSASTSATVDAVLRLGKMGLSSRDIGTILGISFQHAAAVLSDTKKQTPAKKPTATRTPEPRTGGGGVIINRTTPPTTAKPTPQRPRPKADA